jgi:hypothetical protein
MKKTTRKKSRSTKTRRRAKRSPLDATPPTPANSLLRVERIPEPSLVFHNGELHPNPKNGLNDFGPAGLSIAGNHRYEIGLGYVGTGKTIDLAKNWIAQCAAPILGSTEARKRNLFPSFPGFSKDSSFQSSFVWNTGWEQTITSSEISALLDVADRRERFELALDLTSEKVRVLAETDNAPDVVVCALPDEIVESCWSVGGPKQRGGASRRSLADRWLFRIVERARKSGQRILPGVYPELDAHPAELLYRNFRRALKARTMQWKVPTQLVLQASLEERGRLQPTATRAWNMCVALYYKAGCTPWKLQVLQPGTCYVGVSFYRVAGTEQHMQSSLSQVFSDTGEGIVLRGEKFAWDPEKRGRAPHLSEGHGRRLVENAIRHYEKLVGTSPKRVVVHKTSKYWADELQGFRSGLSGVRLHDLVALYQTGVRAFRLGAYPPLRGTKLRIADAADFLYTTGYIPELGTYPGSYVPEPLQIVEHFGDSPTNLLCSEILGLTKMNWNTSDFSSGLPITIRFARRIGDIMQEIPQNQTPDPRYRFYM